ncbi:hypothetical protein Chor_002610 [Crotalus horridus]
MNMTSPSPFSALALINATHCGKSKTGNESNVNEVMLTLKSFTMLVCVLGMLGNGLVIWLLGCSIKRNTFALYIINLSIADFGFLTAELIIEIHGLSTHCYYGFPYELFQMVLLLMYSAGQFLLTVISIDRCISVLFPIWYRCHRPVHLFTIVCAVIWTTSFILSSIHFTIIAVGGFGKSIDHNFVRFGYLCTCINSSINPLIFYLVGRQKGKTQRSIKDLLQKVFKEEENCSDQMETSEVSKI